MKGTLAGLLLLGVTFVAAESAHAQDKNPFPAAKPELQGVSSKALQRLADLVEGFVRNDDVVGAELLVIKNRRTVLHEVFGFLDRGTERPMVKNTIFSIRSMTKPMTGAAVQVLIDEEKLKLDDPVAKYLDAFDNERSRGVTIEHLLTHRSGYPQASAGTLWKNYGSYSDVRQIANYWGRVGPSVSKPGARYTYADANADTLGAVIWKVTGTPTAEFVEARIIEPTGMRDTLTLLVNGDPRTKRVASKYGLVKGRWKRFWRWDGKPYFPFAMSAQGVYATPRDYARFLAVWMDGGKTRGGRRILSETAVKRALTPVSVSTFPTGFVGLRAEQGQMMLLYPDPDAKPGELPIVFGHSGSDGTYAWAWPKQDLIVVYFTQSRGNETRLRTETAVDLLLARPVKAPAKPK